MAYFEHYKTHFDPVAYLNKYCGLTTDYLFHTIVLKTLHEFYQQQSQSGLSVLDFGCGPTIYGIISLAQYSPKIVLAEYAEQNRVEIHKWLQGDSDAFDWTPTIRHVVMELEGKGESQVGERKQQLKDAIQSVVPCDITKDPIMSPEYMKEYDIVHCFLVLAAVSATKEEYVKYLLTLKSLIRPGGKLVLYAINKDEITERDKFTFGGHWFSDLCVSLEFVQDSLAKFDLHPAHPQKRRSLFARWFKKPIA